MMAISRFLLKRYGFALVLFSGFSGPAGAADSSLGAGIEPGVGKGLAAALKATMTHSPAIKGKQAELNETGYAIESAEAGRYPTVSAQADNLNDTQATVRLDQPLWAFGRIDTGIDLAKAKFTAEQWVLRQVQRQLIEETAVAYAQIQGIKARERIAQVNIDEHQRLYQRIERRQKGQLSSEADVRLAYSRTLQADAQMQRIKGSLLVAQTDLRALTYVDVDTSLAVDPALVALPVQAEVELMAIAESADIHYKRLRLESVKLDVVNERLSPMPTLYLRVEHDVLSDNTDDTRIGLTIESRLEGLGFVSKSRVQGAEARFDAAEYDLDNSINDLRQQINALMLNRQMQAGLIDSQSLAVASVEETMASFLRQYKLGRKSWVEVLNTQRELTELRLQLAQIKNDWLVTSLRVAAITGALDLQAGIVVDE